MSFSKTMPYNDTTGAGSKAMSLTGLNLAADFGVDHDGNSNELTLNSITAPKDLYERHILACYDVKNIYSNKGVAPLGQHPNKTGMRMVSKTHALMKLSEDTTTYYGPLSCTLTVEMPSWVELDSVDMLTLIGRTVNALANSADVITTTQSTDIAGFEAKMRGIETPRGLQ